MPFTLISPCEYREEIRKSRFLALASPVTSAAEAQAFITTHSDPSASHNCWAWKVGQQYRFSDDGEPKCLQAAPCVELVAREHYRCHCLFAELPLLKARLSDLDCLLESETYDATGAELHLAVPAPRVAELQRLLADISRGRVELQAQ